LYFQVDAAFNKSSNCYEIKTHKSYKKYDQVFISYGPHNNIHLLLEYGFILSDNPHDVYEIDFGKFFISCLSLLQKYNDWTLRGHRGNDRMVVGFTTTCAISAYHH